MRGEAHPAAEMARSLVAPAVDGGRLDAVPEGADTISGDEEPRSEDALNGAEHAVLVALAGGQSGADIARSLRTSEEMVGIHMANVLAKLHREHAARSAGGPARAGRRWPADARGPHTDLPTHPR